MEESYTQTIGDYILDLPDQETAVIWEDITATPLDTTEELWRKKLNKIARENTFSSRFALMRILCSRALGKPISNLADTALPATVDGFSLDFDGKEYRFRDISMAHAEALTPKEHLAYMACLMEIASRQPDSDPEADAQILSRAWYDTKSANTVAIAQLPESVTGNEKRRKAAVADIAKRNKAAYAERISRDEALLLGHILGFSLEEMQWYLLRVFDVEDTLRFNLSHDLIEAYGFMIGAGWQHVRKLREDYDASAARIRKQDGSDRNNNWTRNIAETLPGRVEAWRLYPETQDQRFLEWMLEKAPELDVPSRTAARIYRNLAAFARDLIVGEGNVPSDSDFADCIRDVYQEETESDSARRMLYEKDILSPVLSKRAADLLLLENKIQCASIQADNTKAWHILTQRKDGSLSAAGGMVNSSRSRVADILAGKIQVEKGDMLYLFWFIANHIWQQNASATAEVQSYRLMDFLELGRELLEEAMLPTFYPPHPLERSMLMSIACAGKLEDEDPSVVYEYMLHATVKPRNGKKKAKMGQNNSGSV